MTRSERRIERRLKLAIVAVKNTIENKAVAPDKMETFINDVSHIVWNRRGLEGHAQRIPIKNAIWSAIGEDFDKYKKEYHR